MTPFYSLLIIFFWNYWFQPSVGKLLNALYICMNSIAMPVLTFISYE